MPEKRKGDMMLKRASLQSGLLLAAVAAFALPLSSVGQARYPFDGRWRVEAVADPSKCSIRYTIAIQVANGRISGAFFGAVARGGVDGNGNLILRIDVVRATGALAARTGLGRWKSPTCNGTWTARRA
jgi:hypothetical protein